MPINNIDTSANEKFKILKNLYEDRLKDMGSHIKNSYNSISKDPVINAMKADPSSAEFVASRVKEMIEDSLYHEKEITINKIQEDLSNSKMEYKKLENEINKYQDVIEYNKKHYENHNKKLEDDHRKLIELNMDFENEIHRLKQQINFVANDKNEMYAKSQYQLKKANDE